MDGNFTGGVTDPWIEAAGVRVEVRDRDGVPIPGFTVDDAVSLQGNQRSAGVSWRSGKRLDELKGKTISLRIWLSCARLYALYHTEEGM